MTTLLFFLEGRSERELLQSLLPRVLPEGLHLEYRCFEGKQDLEKNLVVQLREWRKPDTRFVVLRDQDAEDCREVKRRLTGLCAQAGRPEALVRVACHEVESWYLGDLAAVERALNLSNLGKHQNNVRYRSPDDRPNPAEELARLTGGRYQEVSGSRSIGPHLRVDENRSQSLRALVRGVQRLAGGEAGGD